MNANPERSLSVRKYRINLQHVCSIYQMRRNREKNAQVVVSPRPTM